MQSHMHEMIICSSLVSHTIHALCTTLHALGTTCYLVNDILCLASPGGQSTHGTAHVQTEALHAKIL